MKVLLLDNADLYLTQDLLKDLIKDADYMVVCIKNNLFYVYFSGYWYLVNYANKQISVKDLRQD